MATAAKKPHRPRYKPPEEPGTFTLTVAAVHPTPGGDCDLELASGGGVVDVLTVARQDWPGAWPPVVGAVVRVVPARVVGVG